MWPKGNVGNLYIIYIIIILENYFVLHWSSCVKFKVNTFCCLKFSTMLYRFVFSAVLKFVHGWRWPFPPVKFTVNPFWCLRVSTASLPVFFVSNTEDTTRTADYPSLMKLISNTCCSWKINVHCCLFVLSVIERYSSLFA